ncbi:MULTISPECIES: hypothetical protein [Amycolatopsis]|uniref:Short chain dehydrogenase n=2 Tax=Amycolatopsis TaxID=1813 RepID=A0A1I3J7P3_9PSEU|nr:hypothetical protein [Amycolatopsis sacchari]SFI55915.1 hypothetical protein SAMN05421835_1016 [Amycolatopsis sacchari]
MTGRRALILAGTGMLSEVAEALVRDGWQVVLPSRRYQPLSVPENRMGVAALKALRPRGHVPTQRREPGRARWVEAHWDRPRELAAKAESALGGPADLLVAWVHEQYRRAVLGACERLLAPAAPVVEVRAVGGPEAPEPLLAAHPTQLVLAGSLSGLPGNRPLSHTELSGAVLEAVSRAVEGRPASLHQVGQSRPLVH